MKYTKQQAEKIKKNNLNGLGKYIKPLPFITISGAYYIVPSKMN